MDGVGRRLGVSMQDLNSLRTRLSVPQRQLRCVFVTVPPVLSAIIANALERRGEVQLLAEYDSRAYLAESLATLTPDLLVVGLTPGESADLGAELLESNPLGKVLLLSACGDLATVYDRHRQHSVLSDFSPDNLLTFVLGEI
jgi:DNA-binding NarL/FixJ family response regulator